MKYKIVPVKNIKRLLMAYEAVETRSAGEPGLMLLYGTTGAGKSTAMTWLMVKKNALFVRATATWTLAAMLDSILREMGLEVHGQQRTTNAMLQRIMQRLAESAQPLFVDEADYLLLDSRMLDTLRDIHDMTGIPILIVGMAGIEKRISSDTSLMRFNRRILRWLEFERLDKEDIRQVADQLLEVRIADDLLSKVHQETQGTIGYLIVALSQIESQSRQQGWEEVTDALWGKRPLLIGSPTKRRPK